MVFAKLFDVENGGAQVLVTKEGWSDTDDSFIIKIATQIDIDGAICTASVALAYEEERKEVYLTMFDEYSQSNAEIFRSGMITNFTNES